MIRSALYAAHHNAADKALLQEGIGHQHRQRGDHCNGHPHAVGGKSHLADRAGILLKKLDRLYHLVEYILDAVEVVVRQIDQAVVPVVPVGQPNEQKQR